MTDAARVATRAARTHNDAQRASARIVWFSEVTRMLVRILVVGLLFCGVTIAQDEATDPAKLTFTARTRVETAKGSGRYHTFTKPLDWNAKETAIVVCDMWDKHWCPTATSRVAEMAPRMNEVIKAARKRGVLIIHCPSDTLDFYKDTPQRKLAQAAPELITNIPLKGWCNVDKKIEGEKLPIDDSDGGCDCTDQKFKKNFRAWSRQIKTIEIAEGDAITDSAEAYYLMKQRGINNVIVMGVHTNMCVLGRPFSIRQMRYQHQNVVLMRDMTDTMYNPKMHPKVSHFRGTDLIIEHVEKFVCPTVSSDQILGNAPFRFSTDTRKHLVMLIGEREYGTKESLLKFANEHLLEQYKVTYVHAEEDDKNDFSGITAVRGADVVLVSIRRRALPPNQLDELRAYVRSGRPVIGIRTASHAFSLRETAPPDGHTVWPEFDKEVFGGNYTGHHGNKGDADEKSFVWNHSDAKGHPILANVAGSERPTTSHMYKTSPLAAGTQVLMMGRVGDRKPHEPISWTNTHVGGGRAFYTSLGSREDFADPQFQRLLLNAVRWAAGVKAEKVALSK